VHDPVVLASARKHGVSDDDILHAFRNPLLAKQEDDGLTMIVGPKCDGGLIEVGVSVNDGYTVVVHAMDPARRRFLRRR
jgi:hypothetical protein